MFPRTDSNTWVQLLKIANSINISQNSSSIFTCLYVCMYVCVCSSVTFLFLFLQTLSSRNLSHGIQCPPSMSPMPASQLVPLPSQLVPQWTGSYHRPFFSTWGRVMCQLDIFSQCIPSLWKRNLKYENICPLKYSSPNIWAVVHVIVFSLSPHVLNFYIYILYCWGGTVMCLVCTKSNRLSNIYWKWNCTQIFIQISCLK